MAGGITKVAVIGGNGKVGRLTLQKLKQSGKYEPLAIIRSESQVEWFKSKGIDVKVISLEDTVENLAKALKGQDAVIFSAGAGGKGGLERTFSIDLDGAVKTMEATELNGIKRFIMVSALEAENRDFWYGTELRSYYIAKMYADKELKRTDLDWTIIRPGFYVGDTLGEGTGKFTDDFTSSNTIFRDDTAQVVVDTLGRDSTVKKIITLVNGETPIDEYLSNI